jgi:hypothetical protein
MSRTIFMTGLTLLFVSLFATSSPAAAATQRAKAQIWSDGPGLKAQAQYVEKSKNGTLNQKLQVQVKHALPFQVLQVAVDGNIVGSIQTNAAGRGKLKLKTPKHVIPQIGSGTVITIGAYSGTFFTKADKYGVHGHLALDGTTISGLVKYHQKPRKGQLDRRFFVNLEGATAGETFDVYIGDVLIGTVTADDLGEGSLKLRTEAFAHGAWQPMPADFPALVAGDVVTVGAMTVTLD